MIRFIFWLIGVKPRIRKLCDLFRGDGPREIVMYPAKEKDCEALEFWLEFMVARPSLYQEQVRENWQRIFDEFCITVRQ